MPLVRAMPVSELPPGATAEVRIGGKVFALCNLEGDVHALDGECPCSGGPLGQGVLRDNLLICPWHGRRYDCRTGAHHFDRNVSVPKFPVEIRGGYILIDVP